MQHSTLETTYLLVEDTSNLLFPGWFAKNLELRRIKSARNHPTIHLQPIHRHSIFSPLCASHLCTISSTLIKKGTIKSSIPNA